METREELPRVAFVKFDRTHPETQSENPNYRVRDYERSRARKTAIHRGAAVIVV